MNEALEFILSLYFVVSRLLLVFPVDARESDLSSSLANDSSASRRLIANDRPASPMNLTTVYGARLMVTLLKGTFEGDHCCSMHTHARRGIFKSDDLSVANKVAVND
jgi:hypothetical protein